MRRALVTGIGGQDGFLLGRELLAHGRHVVGTVRPGTGFRSDITTYLGGVEGLDVVELDLRDGVGVAHLLDKYNFDEIYNLASFSSVGLSWQNAELVSEINGMAVLRLLEALRLYHDRNGRAPRFYQASTSEIFGLAEEQPQTEHTPHHPRSPYAVAKSFAHHLTVNYRESYGLFACSGILYNHESPVRGAGFVTRKITRAVAEIALGRREELTLGNLDIRRDWGHAAEYVGSMRLMLEADDPADYIVATGVAHSLEEFINVAFDVAGLGDPGQYVRQNPDLMRPADVMELRGDATKAREQLGWVPQRGFREIIEEMVRVDMRRIETGVEDHRDYLPAL
ncbi:GDP-mannose 4,6-dehydratase [Nocardioides sp.]|uniref:GDP-mannose 4,6-dehydratase n=1 Tax=Nocardioides sp. TaxID=35761 RepID=UPI003568C786